MDRNYALEYRVKKQREDQVRENVREMEGRRPMTDKATDVTVTLKPCPKCQSEDVRFGGQFYNVKMVVCSACLIQTACYPSQEAAARAWNHRTASDQPASGEAIDPDDLETLIDDAISDSFELDWTSMRGARAVVGALEHVGWSVVKGQPLSTTSEAPEAGRLREALGTIAFLTCVSGDGPTPYLKVHFNNLADAHAAHDELLGKKGKN